MIDGASKFQRPLWVLSPRTGTGAGEGCRLVRIAWEGTGGRQRNDLTMKNRDSLTTVLAGAAGVGPDDNVGVLVLYLLDRRTDSCFGNEEAPAFRLKYLRLPMALC